MIESFAALEIPDLSQISLGTAGLILGGVCAIFAVLRGVFRLVVGTLSIGVSGFVAYQAWRYVPGLIGFDFPWMSLVVPTVAGVATLIILRKILHFVAKPWGKSEDDEDRKSRPLSRKALTLLLSLAPSSMLWFGGATALRNVGSVAEIRSYVEGKESTGEASDFLTKMRSAINQVLPKNWIGGADPLADDARVALAKLIARGDDKPLKAIPVSEEDELKYLISESPELRKFAKEKRYADLLNDPRLVEILKNPQLREQLAALKL